MFPSRWFKKLSLIATAIVLPMCHTVKVEKVVATATPIRADGQALTSEGDNSQPSFSPDGQKMVFVGAERVRHKVGQIYEMDLKSHKERRITFQVAAAHDPQYSPNGETVVYSSATDELKENPPILNSGKTENFTGPAEFLEPTELYLHHLRGLAMERLTKHPGYDGQPHFLNSKEVFFTRRSGKSLSIFETRLPANTRAARPWKGAGERAAQLTPHGDKQFLWIEYASDFQTTELMVRNGHKTEKILSDIHAMKKDPAWTPDGNTVVFSMNYPKPEVFEIYAVKTDGSCLTALTKDGVKAEHPAVSPTGDAFAFASNQSGSRQIYIKVFPKELNCAPPAPAPVTAPSPQQNQPKAP